MQQAEAVFVDSGAWIALTLAWTVPTPQPSNKHTSGGERRQCHFAAKVDHQCFDEALFLPVGGAAIEVIAAEALVQGSLSM
jgi:hypothetical protein